MKKNSHYSLFRVNSFHFQVVLLITTILPCAFHCSDVVRGIPGSLSTILDSKGDVTSSVKEATLLCLTTGKLLSSADGSFHPTDDWLSERGYKVLKYKVTTEDGYILNVFRVQSSPNYKCDERIQKPVVFLNHGIAFNSNQWMVQEGQNNYVTRLADDGYEIWIGNCRGNKFSNEHTTLNVENSAFWEFSFHEIGVYDASATIDAILEITQVQNIIYIGFSLGSTQAFVLLSEKPEYRHKISLMVLLAPAAIVSHGTSPIRLFSSLDLSLKGRYLSHPVLGGRINNKDLFPKLISVGVGAGTLCAISTLTRCGLCEIGTFFLFGVNPVEVNHTAVTSFYANSLDAFGTKSLVHYSQQANDPYSRFRKFDYGPDDNNVLYGFRQAPEYNLSNVEVPMYLFYGRGDNLVSKQDVEALVTKFKPGVVREVNLVDPTNLESAFSHIDFVIGRHIDKLVINPILNILNSNTVKPIIPSYYSANARTLN